jgi:hypothetical protein
MRAVAISMVLVAGCSFLVTSAPAAPPAAPDCVGSVFPPIADIGLAFGALIGTEISAGLGDLGDDKASSSGLGFFVPALAVAAASSIYGFVRTSQCRNAYEARANTPIYAPPAAAVPGPYPQPMAPRPAQ